MTFSTRKPSVLLPLICLLFICSPFVFAQDKVWRDITQADLDLKAPRVEADADAEAIFWEVRIDDSSENDLKKFTYVRVKIFTERGRERFSKVDIPFGKDLKVKDVAARVVKPDGTIVELRPDEIFEREIIRANGIKIKAKSFAVPNIEMGTIIEYRYREIFKDSGAVGMRLVFQKDFPVQTLSYYYKPNGKNATPNYQAYNFTDTKFVKDDKGFWLAQRNNVPSYKEEPNMPPEDQVLPWMLIQSIRIGFVATSNDSIGFVFKDPRSPQLYWGAVSTEKLSLFGYMTKPNKDVKKMAEQITASATTPEEKLRKLFDFCHTQIKNRFWDMTLSEEERYKRSTNKSHNDTLKRMSGDSVDVDLLFGAMASSLGFDTRMVYGTNRSEIFFKPEMTSDYFIHFAAIAVKVGEDFKFFDPCTPFKSYGTVNWFEEGTYAMLISEAGYVWGKIPVTPADKSVARRTGKFKLLEDGTLEGDVRIEYSGQLGFSYKANAFDESPNQREEVLKERIKARMSTAEVSSIGVENVNDPNNPFVYTYKIRVPNYAQKTGKRLFLQPSFFEYGESPLFSSATRKYDIYFNYPWSELDTVEIQYPAGYSLDNADAPAPVADPQKIGSHNVKIAVIKEQNTLKYERKFFFGGGGTFLFPSAAYQPLKNLFDAFSKADAHTITLRQN